MEAVVVDSKAESPAPASQSSPAMPPAEMGSVPSISRSPESAAAADADEEWEVVGKKGKGKGKKK